MVFTVETGKRLIRSPSTKGSSRVELISDAFPFGRLWDDTPDQRNGLLMRCSCPHDAVIHIYNDAGNLIETHEHTGDFMRPNSYWLGSQLYRKPYASAQCVRAVGDSSTLTMIK